LAKTATVARPNRAIGDDEADDDGDEDDDDDGDGDGDGDDDEVCDPTLTLIDTEVDSREGARVVTFAARDLTKDIRGQ